jgi:hypothetical protein
MHTLKSARLAVTALAMAVFCLGGYSVAARADDVAVMLTGDQEVPPVQTDASGKGTITVKPDMSVSGSVTTNGVEGSMAHIHQGPSGQEGPVIIPLTKSGASTWSVPSGAKLTDAQYQAYKAGSLYVNVHSAAHKGGEIRGQLKP